MPLIAREQTRRNLLPTWVQVFCWLFLVAGTLAPTVLIARFFYSAPMHFALFGWEHEGSPFDPYSLLILGYFVASGIAAYGLLRGKLWGWAAGATLGSIGLALSLASLAHARQAEGGFYFSLEPLLQIPFLYVLWRIRAAWLSGAAPVDASSSFMHRAVAAVDEPPVPLLPRFLITIGAGTAVLAVYSICTTGSFILFGNLVLSSLITVILLLPLRFLLALLMPRASQQSRATIVLTILLVLVTLVAFAMSPNDLPQGRLLFWVFWAFYAALTAITMFWPSVAPPPDSGLPDLQSDRP